MSISHELHDRARALLDPQAYDFFASGSGVEQTLASNEQAWTALRLRPRVARDVGSVDATTTLLGTPIAAPVAAAPVGFLRLMHAGGESGAARGTASANTLFTLSTRSSSSFEEIVPLADPWWFGVYILRDRDLTAELVHRAVEAGARALVLTVDTPYVAVKARSSAALATVPGGLLPRMMSERNGTHDRDSGIEQAPDVIPADIGWLHRISGGLPIVVKGVLRGDDARRLIDAGASAIWVSNHGGRQLDGALPTALALPEVANAVGNGTEVYVDGGIRTGRDVLRALGSGARAVFVGRPLAWALAVGGAEGVRRLFENLRDETVEALELAGCSTPMDATGDLLDYPITPRA